MAKNAAVKRERRSSIFKPNESAAPVLQNLHYPADYTEKLITEINEWTDLISESLQARREYKSHYPPNVTKKVDKSILSKDQLDFLQDAVDYNDYLYQVQKITNKAKVVIASHNNTKEVLGLQKALVGNKIERVDEILLMKMNERPK